VVKEKSLRKILLQAQNVIASDSVAIASMQFQPRKVRDCFVPRNDIFNKFNEPGHPEEAVAQRAYAARSL
jgi:hypothetical protein